MKVLFLRFPKWVETYLWVKTVLRYCTLKIGSEIMDLKKNHFQWRVFTIVYLKIALSQHCFHIQRCFTPFWKPTLHFHQMFFSIVHLKIAISLNCFDLQTFFTPFWKPYNQAITIDYLRSHQNYNMQTKFKVGKNRTWIHFHQMFNCLS